MTRALFISLLFHAIIVAILIMGLPHLSQEVSESPDSTYVVELVEIGEETTKLAPTPAAKPREEEPPPAPEVKPEPEPEPEPEPQPAAPPPPPPEPEPVPEPPAPEPEPEPEPVPEPPAPEPQPVPEPPAPEPEPVPEPEPEPEPIPEPEPEPEPVREVVKQPPPPPVKPKVPEAVLKAEREQPKPQEQPKPKDDFDSLLSAVNDLDKSTPTKPAPSQPAPTTPSNNGRLAEILSSSEKDAIMYHVQKFWASNQAGIGLEDELVKVRVQIDINGNVISAEPVLTPEQAANPALRALAESARRTTLRSSPLPVPANKASSFLNEAFFLTFTPNDLGSFY